LNAELLHYLLANNKMLLRHRDGNLSLLDERGKAEAPKLPTERPPAATVRAGNNAFAYQKTDGTWLVLDDSPALAAKAQEIGPVFDLGIFKINSATFGDVQILAWIEAPEETLKALERAKPK
jgi:hypothetical protein